MKKSFITGIVILLPLALTVLIVVFLINLLTDPFVDIVHSALRYYGLLNQGFLFLSARQVQMVASQALILLSLFIMTVFIGVIARWFFINYLIKMWDALLHRIPFIRSVYKTCQDVINTILTSDTKSFKQAVIVPFPTPDSHSIGLVTREHFEGIPTREGEKFVAVFVPTTPNPTSGYLILYDEKELTYLDIRVEDALKYIISCGVILNKPFQMMAPSNEEPQQ